MPEFKVPEIKAPEIKMAATLKKTRNNSQATIHELNITMLSVKKLFF